MASGNPGKVKAVESGFARMFPGEEFSFEGVIVPSGVSDQPMSDKETYEGAQSRVEAVSRERPDADFWVGLEGGADEDGEDLYVFAWAIVKRSDGRVGKAKTGTFYLPHEVARLVREGKELAEADSIVFGRENAKHKGGVSGLLTGDAIDRPHLYADGIVHALIPFKHEAYY